LAASVTDKAKLARILLAAAALPVQAHAKLTECHAIINKRLLIKHICHESGKQFSFFIPQLKCFEIVSGV
jgi:hypothetical protein